MSKKQKKITSISINLQRHAPILHIGASGSTKRRNVRIGINGNSSNYPNRRGTWRL